jgi:hypothetical protein
MGNAREIRRNNETALGPAPSEPPALPPRPLVETIPNNTRVIENQDAGNIWPFFHQILFFYSSDEKWNFLPLIQTHEKHFKSSCLKKKSSHQLTPVII